jgi:hypothetical protein
MPRYLLDPSSTVLTHLHAAGAQMDEIALGTTHLGPAIFAHKTDAASDSGTPISLWNVH